MSSPIPIPGPSHLVVPTFPCDAIANSPGTSSLNSSLDLSLNLSGQSSGTSPDTLSGTSPATPPCNPSGNSPDIPPRNVSGPLEAAPPARPSPSFAGTKERSAQTLSDAATTVLLTAAKVAVEDFRDLHTVVPPLARLMLSPMDHEHVDGQRVPTQLAKVLLLAINARMNSEEDADKVATALLGPDYREIANRPQPRLSSMLGLHPIRSASPLGNMCATLEDWLVKDERLGPILRDTVKLLQVLLPEDIALDFNRYLTQVREQPDRRQYGPSTIVKRLDVHTSSAPDCERSRFPSDSCATDVTIETTKLIRMVNAMVDTANLKYLPRMEQWQQADAVQAACRATEAARLLDKKEKTAAFVAACIANSHMSDRLHLQRKAERKTNDRAAHAAQHAANLQRAYHKRERWMGAMDVSARIASAVTVFTTPHNAPRASIVVQPAARAGTADTWSLKSFDSVSSLGSLFQQLDMRDGEAALARLPSLPSNTSLDRITADPKRVHRTGTLLSMRADRHDAAGLWLAPPVPTHQIGTPSPPGPSMRPPRGPRPTERALARD